MTIQCSIGTDSSAPPIEGHWSFRSYFLLGLVALGVILGLDLLDGEPFTADVDDLLRQVEIRNLVAGAGWFDMSIASVRMPETYVLPWSRLVDLPYALIAWMLGPAVGQERALAVAFLLWPPVLGAIFLTVQLGCLHRLAPRRSELPVSLLLAIPAFAIYSIWEFTPGRIDHHNVQIVLLALLAYGVLRWDGLGGAMIGAASSLSLAVGLETLPLLSVALGSVSLAWLLGVQGSTAVIRSVGAACAVGTLLLAVALIEPSRYLASANDTFSAPYAAALAGFGLIAAIAGAVLHKALPMQRAVIFLGAQLGLVAAILSCFPGLLNGPLPMLTGLAEVYWFDRIGLERNVFWLFSAGDMRSVAQFLAVFAVIALATPSLFRTAVRGEGGWATLFLMTLTAVAMACASTRFLQIALGLAALFLPAAYRNLKRPDAAWAGRTFIVTCIAVLAGLAVGRMYVFPPERQQWDAFDHFIRRDCRGEDLAGLRALQPGRIMTPPGLGIEIVHRRLAGLSVSAIPFHRASAAISNVLAVAMGSTAAENADLLKDFDYLAVCRIPAGLPNEDKLPLLGDLQAGRSVPGLRPLPGSGAILIFRIDHAQMK